MIQKIIEGISIAIHGAFEEYEIHAYNKGQDLNEPCFLITVIDYVKEQLLGNRSKRMLPFDVLFFPSKGKQQCWEVADKLMNALAIIETVDGDKFAGTGMDANIEDDVLHFRVNFNFIADVPKEKDEVMEEFTANVKG